MATSDKAQTSFPDFVDVYNCVLNLFSSINAAPAVDKLQKFHMLAAPVTLFIQSSSGVQAPTPATGADLHASGQLLIMQASVLQHLFLASVPWSLNVKPLLVSASYSFGLQWVPMQH